MPVLSVVLARSALLLSAVALLLSALAALVAWRWPRPVIPMTSAQVRAALLSELQPVEIENCRLERFGEPNDGGYLMCGNLLDSVKAGYSYGISGYDQWGCDVARRLNVRVHQYDCFDLEKPVCRDGVTVFHAECIAPARTVDEAGRIFDSFDRQVASNGDAAKRVVVKIDVEGAEWQTFLETPPEVLQRIDQLVVEFHGVDREHYLAAVRRLKEFFVVGNLHINNYACQPGLEPWPAWAYEVLFVSKRIAVAGNPRPAGAHPLDAPNKPTAADCQAAVR